MRLKSRLNIVALLSITTVVVLFGFLFYTTWQINNELNQIEEVNTFSKTASELNIITEEYLTYQESKYHNMWMELFQKLQNTKEDLTNFPTRSVVTKALPSIKQAYDLIQDTYQNPESYQDTSMRKRLQERATARIRSDIQLLLSASNRIEQNRIQEVRDFQVYQRLQVLFILIPGIGFVIFMIFRVRKQILQSLGELLEGTQSIAKGNLDKKITLNGFREHNKLARAFNSMTAKLRENIQSQKKLRKEAEQNLKRWEALVDQDPSMIMIHRQGEILFINEGGIKIFGADSAQHLIGTKVFDYISEAHKNKAIERINHLEKDRQAVSPTVYRVKRFDGEYRYLKIQSVPITFKGESATQTVGIDITEHISYEEELQESLEEKSVLLQEIHHRVKNNLAVISGMMQLQAMESDNRRLVNKLHDSQLRIQSMALIHELLYDSQSFAELQFAEQLRRLVQTISETLQERSSIDINFQMEDVTINVNQAIPCALIVNELVTNAFKHAFKGREDGTINIEMRSEEGNILHLTVSDDGVGLPADFDIHTSSSLGMRIIQTLCQQLDATIQYEENNGSIFSIRFQQYDVKGIGSAKLN